MRSRYKGTLQVNVAVSYRPVSPKIRPAASMRAELPEMAATTTGRWVSAARSCV